MHVDKELIDSVNAKISITVLKADYQDKVEKALKNLKKKANVPGFRPGHVPTGLIQKMYGKSVLAEEVQNTVSEALYNYIKETKLSLLGEPLPALEQAEINFDTQEDFTFDFDVALSPELEFSLNKKDVVPYYTIEVSDEMVEEQVKSMSSRNGSYEQVEVSEEKDVIKGDLIEVLTDESNEEPLRVEDAVLMPAYVKNDAEKAKLLGVKVGDAVVMNPALAYDGSESEIASLLKLPKEVAKDLTSDFRLEVKEITRYKEGELNQVLFDMIYGKDEVKTEEAFRARIRTSLEGQLSAESDYRFMVDAKNVLLKKVQDVAFPVEFLKRWILMTKEDQTPEQVEQEMPQMIEDLKWHLMKEKLVAEKELKVTEEALLETSKAVVRAQFAQYGMSNVPEDLLNSYAADMLKKEDSRRNIIDQAMSTVVGNYLKETVKLNAKSVSMEDFNKLYA